MSSVLKALKKLEKEQPSPDVDHRQWLRKTPPERSLHDRFRQRLRFHPLTYGIWAAILFLLFGGTAIILRAGFFQPTSLVSSSGQSLDKTLTLKPVQSKNEQGKNEQGKNEQRQVVSETVAPDQGAAISSKIEFHGQETVPDSLGKLISNPQPAVGTPAESVPLNAMISVSKHIKKQSLKKKTLEEQATKSIEAPRPLIGKGSSETVSVPPEPDGEDNVEILKDPAMKIQAISWNKSPSSRLAVISSHVVRQGDQIEQYTVIQINQGDIILGKDAKRWKILF